VESSATGWEIKFRSIGFTDTFTLPVRTGSGGVVVVVVVEEVSRLLTRMVKALARDMLMPTSSVSRCGFEVSGQQRAERDAVPARAAFFEIDARKQFRTG